MKRRPRKKLNIREAESLVKQMTGARWYALRNLQGSLGRRCEIQIYRCVGHVDTFHGKGWREALHNAGLYWEPEYD